MINYLIIANIQLTDFEVQINLIYPEIKKLRTA